MSIALEIFFLQFFVFNNFQRFVSKQSKDSLHTIRKIDFSSIYKQPATQYTGSKVTKNSSVDSQHGLHAIK